MLDIDIWWIIFCFILGFVWGVSFWTLYFKIQALELRINDLEVKEQLE